MGYAKKIGQYMLSRTIGEGMFAKVKLAVNVSNGRFVAVKIIDKRLVVQSNLNYQIQSEIRTMKLLHHSNIVRIHEVIGTKERIYIIMEYASGGRLLDKLSHAKRLNELEARRLFQQLIDAVDYCHHRGIYHRDLKPENLLLDGEGNLKVSDFGLSSLHKPGGLLTTSCGSPCYMAPELLSNMAYDGAAADVWSCGVVLFELLAGYLPFNEYNLKMLYRKISRADYACPPWFTQDQKRLISRILDPDSRTRIRIQDMIQDRWFQTNYEPSANVNSEDASAAIVAVEDDAAATWPSIQTSSGFINAFQLIAMSHDLDLSSLFEQQEDMKQTTRLGSNHTVGDTMKKIEAAAMDASLSVERRNCIQMKMHPAPKLTRTRCSRSHYDLSTEVIEVAPMNCVVEITQSACYLTGYNEEFVYLAISRIQHPVRELQWRVARPAKHTHAHTLMHVHTFVHTHTHTRVHTHVYMHTHVCTHVYIYTRAHTHDSCTRIHAHTRTYMCVFDCVKCIYNNVWFSSGGQTCSF